MIKKIYMVKRRKNLKQAVLILWERHLERKRMVRIERKKKVSERIIAE